MGKILGQPWQYLRIMLASPIGEGQGDDYMSVRGKVVERIECQSELGIMGYVQGRSIRTFT